MKITKTYPTELIVDAFSDNLLDKEKNDKMTTIMTIVVKKVTISDKYDNKDDNKSDKDGNKSDKNGNKSDT